MIYPQKKLFLLDGMSLVYRAYFALGHLAPTTAQGIETGAILGFVNTLVEVLQKEKPTHLIVAFDGKEKTFRHQLFPAYKSHRTAQPEAISVAIPYIKAILDGFGIVSLTSDGYEADDLLGTLASQAATMGATTYIMSTDKDLAQMVSETIYLYKPSSHGQKATILGQKEINTQWEIARPAQVKDILALEGDPSDFIPGIPSIGKKTARKLIKEFDNLENLLAHSHKLTGKLKANLIQYADQGLLSKQLATIRTDVPITLDLEKCHYQGPNRAQLEPLFTLLEFKQLKERLFGKTDPPKVEKTPVGLFESVEEVGQHSNQRAPTPREDLSTGPASKLPAECAFYKKSIVSTSTACQKLVQKLQAAPLWAFDITTTSLDPHQADLLGITFTYETGQADYIALPRDATAAQPFLSLLGSLFQHSHGLKVGHDLKQALIVLQRHGLTVAPPLFDTMIAHSLVAPDMRHTLSNLSEQYLTLPPEHADPPANRLSAKRTYAEEFVGDTERWNRSVLDVREDLSTGPASKLRAELELCRKSNLTLQVYPYLVKALTEQGLDVLFYQVEMPLVAVLVAMESAGVFIDLPFLAELGKEMEGTTNELKEKIYSLAQTKFNIDSPKQLGKVLFEQLRLHEKPTKTKTGQYATGEEVLAKLAKVHPIVPLIMEHRTLQKLRSTYVDALPTMIHPLDKRLHTTYHQTVVTTGRLSSTAPNLQNIPIKTTLGSCLRKAFIPHNKGDLLFSADYSQIELRIMAAYAQDATMIRAFQADKDIHQITASKLFKTEAVDQEMRRKAKVANFGILYGISPFGLAERMGNLSRKEAAELISAYFAEFPGIKRYMDQVIADARRNGYVTTLMGRKRFLPNLNGRNSVLRAIAERNAINMPIQGSAAEMIKLAMIQIQHWLERNKLKSKLIIQVHDELVFNVPEAEIADVENQIPLLMAQALPLENVPIKVNWNIGSNWLEAHQPIAETQKPLHG